MFGTSCLYERVAKNTPRKILRNRKRQRACKGEPPEERKARGNDIRVAEFGWPIGMPLCRTIKGHKGLWEIRANLSGGRKARVFFCSYEGNMVLLHGFIKKSQKTPINEMEVAVKRMRGLLP
ncbi:type II toxin-antitoxin system RelE/ParE family toxin [Desulfobulbus alkaliphilus]|uniref:type II toxin-antitoxin system RelE/ParE family toxin n=1 Tax=Desulfobulbus alkaliphilus TaxID=869814 RepID=UPI0019650245|nr:type II toxin-antitoxin system RelE/ParE family toxin [Desulfobulbus alkaliphilus]